MYIHPWAPENLGDQLLLGPSKKDGLTPKFPGVLRFEVSESLKKAGAGAEGTR